MDAPNNVVAGGLVEQLVVSTCHTSALCFQVGMWGNVRARRAHTK